MSARKTPAPSAQIYAIAPHRALSQAQRRRYWRAMRSALRQRSLVLGQSNGVCMVLAVGHPLGAADRRHVLDWLLDQPHTREVIVGPQLSFEQLFSPTLEVRGEDTALKPDEVQRLCRFLRSVLGRALCHYAVALRQASQVIQGVSHV